MTNRLYIGCMALVVGSVFVIPDIGLKGYALSILTAITAIINLFFQLAKLRKWFVRVMTADIVQEMLKSPDLQKLIEMTVKENTKRRRR